MSKSTPNSVQSIALFAKAEQVEETMNELTEDLNFGDYDALREVEVKLRTLANFVVTSRQDEYLEEALLDADELIDFMMRRTHRTE